MNKNHNGAKNIVKIPTSAHTIEYNQDFDIGVFMFKTVVAYSST